MKALALLLFCAAPGWTLNASKHNDADAAEYAGVVFIPRSGRSGCTGALIAPRVVLTAAHCLRGTRPERVYFGQGLAARRAAAVEEAAMHPSFPPGLSDEAVAGLDEPGSAVQDVAYLLLSEDAPEPAYAVTDAVPQAGETLRAAGYGGNALGLRNFLDLTILRRSPNPSRLVASAGVMGGDSGGPLFYRVDGRLVVAAVASSLTSEGRWRSGDSRYALLRPALPWLRERLGALLP